MQYQRYAVAADEPGHGLGDVALRLLQLGVDVLYAPALDEAALLTRQEAQRVGVVLLPAGVIGSDCQRLPQLFGVLPARLVPVASPGDDLSVWARAGALLALRRPCTDPDLRFAVQAALAYEDHGEFRLDLRAPIRAEARLTPQGPEAATEQTVTLLDVSGGGVYVAMAEPLAPGQRALLALPEILGGSRVEIESVFVHRAAPGMRGARETGMGAMFLERDMELRSCCRRYVRSQIARFEIPAPQP